jgi:hypothetical protein
MKPPKGLTKLKAALRKIVRVPKTEEDRRIAEEGNRSETTARPKLNDV